MSANEIHKHMKLNAFTVAGIAVRTTNNGGKAQEDIGALWARFYAEQVASRISGKESEDLYCVYTDYESDFTGAYTCLLGYKVAAAAPLPEGLARIQVPASLYRKYTAAGKLPDAVVKVWMEIWQSPPPRAYKADFDVYGAGAADPANAVVDVFVSVV